MKKRKIETPLFTVLGLHCMGCVCRCGPDPLVISSEVSPYNNEWRGLEPDKLGSFALKKAD